MFVTINFLSLVSFYLCSLIFFFLTHCPWLSLLACCLVDLPSSTQLPLPHLPFISFTLSAHPRLSSLPDLVCLHVLISFGPYGIISLQWLTRGVPGWAHNALLPPTSNLTPPLPGPCTCRRGCRRQSCCTGSGTCGCLGRAVDLATGQELL